LVRGFEHGHSNNNGFAGTGPKTLRRRDNSGVEVDSTYDPRNLLTNLVWQGGGIAAVSAAFAYDSRGLLTGVNRYADAAGTQLVNQETLSYNSRGELTNLNYLDALSQAFLQYQDSYDPAGQLAEEIYNGQTSQFTYDPVGQLIQALRSNGQNESFAWDANGNPTGPGYVIGRNNQLLSDGTFNYQYDANGNLEQKTEIATGNVTTYSYDVRNRLIEVETKSQGGIVLSDLRYIYDMFDRRIAVETNGVNMVTVYDRLMAWADYDTSGNVLTRYLAGHNLNQWIARWQPGSGTAWFLTDRLGSVRDIINGGGQLIDHIDYTSFGSIAFQSNPYVGGRFLFTGLAYDPVSGLYNTTSTRQFDPSMTRFISQDFQGFNAGDADLYRYSENSPLNFVDPTGLDSRPIASPYFRKPFLPNGRTTSMDINRGSFG
jgi:RHS repeat-associated protein